MSARTLMIQGTASNVGKSLLVAGYCRLYARRGYKVAPFKAQNMALNSYVTPDGLELGRAQALQAYACGREPDIRMNPILLKPEAHHRSQIVLMGKPLKSAAGSAYYKERSKLWPHVTEALDSLRAENDLVIVEGAGSPAEINLKQYEIVNMRVARYLNAPVLLAVDIDQGGSFAFLYGTLMLLPPEEQALVKGFLFNKFRGDVELLKPGLKMLEDLTDGRPTLGVIPMMKDLFLAQEDSVFIEKNRLFGSGRTDIAVIHYPRMSNYDDMDGLTLEEDLQVRFVSHPRELGNPDGIILPGSKSTLEDLRWLKSSGLADRIIELARTKSLSVGGICGGYQMMGRILHDPEGIEGPPGSEAGLNLLPVETVMTGEKRTERVTLALEQDRSALLEGYEIHMGRSTRDNSSLPLFIHPESGQKEGSAMEDGRLWGTYLHGLFDDPAYRRRWLRSLGWTSSAPARSLTVARDSELDRLADCLEENSDTVQLDRLIGLSS
ncbi:MAG: cobyric acid synthase [Spirochaetales bacterium]|nr:cobyric acid synthase [Spirochaetales bacterium]